MSFSNPITGGQGTLVRPAIKSPNYVAGSSGWTINRDGSAEFNNLTLRGTFNGTDYVINSSGAFFYSGTPAAGNLITSITRATGTDAFGNAYLAGVTTYDNANHLYINLNSAIISQGTFAGGAFDSAQASQLINGGGGELLIEGPTRTASGFNDAVRLALVAGVSGGLSGTTSPFVQLLDGLGTSPVDLLLSGNVIKTDNSGAPENWHVVGTTGQLFQTNWTTTTTFNGSGNYGGTLRFRKDGEDNLIFDGIWAAGGSAPGTTVFTLPVGYRPKATGRVWTQEANGGVLTSGYSTVDTSGNFNVRTASGLTLAANATYQCSGFVPLGNIP